MQLMADHAKKTKASVKEDSNGQRELESKGPKQTGSPLGSQSDGAKKKSDKKSSDKKRIAGLEAYDLFRKLKKSWPEDMPRLFDPSLAEDRRVELWQVMCEGGESLRRRQVLIICAYVFSICSTPWSSQRVWREVNGLQVGTNCIGGPPSCYLTY